MKPLFISTVLGIVLLLVGLPPQAKSTCINPNSMLNATYGWEGHALGAAGNAQGANWRFCAFRAGRTPHL